MIGNVPVAPSTLCSGLPHSWDCTGRVEYQREWTGERAHWLDAPFL